MASRSRPASTVTLAPQGTHVMLMGLDEPLVAGERFPLTLQFATAGTVTVTVRRARARRIAATAAALSRSPTRQDRR